MKVCFSPNTILCGWLGLKNQQTNSPIPFAATKSLQLQLSDCAIARRRYLLAGLGRSRAGGHNRYGEKWAAREALRYANGQHPETNWRQGHVIRCPRPGCFTSSSASISEQLVHWITQERPQGRQGGGVGQALISFDWERESERRENRKRQWDRRRTKRQIQATRDGQTRKDKEWVSDRDRERERERERETGE